MVSDPISAHDELTQAALAALLGGSMPGALGEKALAQATLPARLGGLGLRDSRRISPAAYFGSWAKKKIYSYSFAPLS